MQSGPKIRQPVVAHTGRALHPTPQAAGIYAPVLENVRQIINIFHRIEKSFLAQGNSRANCRARREKREKKMKMNRSIASLTFFLGLMSLFGINSHGTSQRKLTLEIFDGDRSIVLKFNGQRASSNLVHVNMFTKQGPDLNEFLEGWIGQISIPDDERNLDIIDQIPNGIKVIKLTGDPGREPFFYGGNGDGISFLTKIERAGRSGTDFTPYHHLPKLTQRKIGKDSQYYSLHTESGISYFISDEMESRNPFEVYSMVWRHPNGELFPQTYIFYDSGYSEYHQLIDNVKAEEIKASRNADGSIGITLSILKGPPRNYVFLPDYIETIAGRLTRPDDRPQVPAFIDRIRGQLAEGRAEYDRNFLREHDEGGEQSKPGLRLISCADHLGEHEHERPDPRRWKNEAAPWAGFNIINGDNGDE